MNYLIFILLFSVSIAHADDFDQLLDSIKQDYHSGHYQSARDSLHQAEIMILDARLTLLNSAIPNQIAGWKKVEVESHLEKFGIVQAVEKDFVQNDKRLQIILAPDQPLLAVTLKYDNEPKILIHGISTAVFYDEKNATGQVAMSPSPAVFAVLRGENISKKELISLASNLNFAILTGFK